MLNFDTRLFPHHVYEQRLYDFSAPAAAVTEHPSGPGPWGLKNPSPQKWAVSTTAGAVKDVGPGRSVTLAVGARIQFGEAVGEVKL
jgi:eukaryotic-like serine/threonine-protein kinase